YENVFLPLLNAFGLDAILDYVYTTKDSDGKLIADTINEGKADKDKLPRSLMTPEEYYSYIYKDGVFDKQGMGDAVKIIINNVFNFLEILLTCPVSTLSVALPTLSYFIYGDGLTTLISNLLIPVTTLTDRLKEIIALDINSLASGLIDMLATGSWESFQEALQSYVTVNEETGEIVVNEVAAKSLTDSLLSFLGSIEFDLSSILAPKDTEITEENKDQYKYGLVLFLNKDAELEAKQLIADGNEDEARKVRGGAIKDFFKSIAALGDEEESSPILDKNKRVAIDNKGQVKVSKAEILMFVLEFAFKNTTLKEVLGSILGYDITDKNGDDAELLDQIITNVFNNPDALVEVIVDLLTKYDVKPQLDVKLIDVENETHAEFYEDAGYESHEAVLEAIANGEDVSELSRVKTSLAIDNLDALVGTILNIFKEQLTTQDDPATPDKDETGLLAKIGLTADDNITLKAAVDALLKNFVYKDDTLNGLMSTLVNALGSGNMSQMVNIIVTVLEGAGYSLTPQTFAKNVPALKDVIGDAKKWSQVAKANLEYVYSYKDGENTVNVYSKNADETKIDGHAVTPVYEQAKDKDGNALWEDEDQTIPVYSTTRARSARIHATWGIEKRDQFIDTVWSLIKPLASIFEVLLTGGNLTIYEKVNIRGLEGYKGVILPLFNALAISKLNTVKDKDGNQTPYLETFYDNYEDFEKAVYGEDAVRGNEDDNLKLLLTTITDAVFAFVDSLCDRPVSTLATILPYLARFIASDGIDAILENLLAPITTITEKISVIYNIDLLKMIKDLLRNVVKTANEEAGAATVSYNDPTEQAAPAAMLAAYALSIIEENETGISDGSASVGEVFALNAIAPAFNDAIEPQADARDTDFTFLDIIWDILRNVKINGVALSSIVSDTLFVDLASCAWMPEHGSYVLEANIDDGKRGGSIERIAATEYTVDRETVLLKVLDWVVFNDGIRDLVGGLINVDFSKMGELTEEDTNYLLTVFLYGVFDDATAVERLVIDLLSWYDV
ncbi:MAG: hypothetical protein NC110_08885, partial [Ruminococcus sp.]|nr:hypothetical protein [Ruminococcus sp.]